MRETCWRCICSSCLSSCSFQGEFGFSFYLNLGKGHGMEMDNISNSIIFALPICSCMLWAPFLNFRKFPRDRSMKYPWSTPQNPTQVKNAFLKYPFAKPEDYR